MASATLATDAVWEEAIKLEERNVELLKSMRTNVVEYERNREAISHSLRTFLPIGIPTSVLAPALPTNGHKVTAPPPTSTPAKATVKAVSLPNPKTSTKTSFVEACFRQNPSTNPRDINHRWVKGEGEGTISPSLVYKIKHEMKPKGEKRVAAAARKVQESDTESNTGMATAVAESPSEIQQIIWRLLSQEPMTTGELYTAIQDDDLLDPMPKDLNEAIKTILNDLRTTKKVVRGEERRYGIAPGASLE